MEFVWKIVAMIIMIAGIAIIAGIVNIMMNRRKLSPRLDKISFRESMNLIELPIITFENNGKKLNFLLDTGASYSSINEADLEGVAYVKTGDVGCGMGIEGNMQEDREYIRMMIDYNNKIYEEKFQILDLSQAFGLLKKEYGVTLHGILGNTFFTKYEYVLNFAELVAYSTK
jgi:hypothetical protein